MPSPIVQSIRVEDGIFWFDLDEAIVDKILFHHQAQNTLHLPTWLRKWLRKAVLYDISEETAREPRPTSRPTSRRKRRFVPRIPTIQSGLTFISCYQNTPVLQTIVGLDGDILNKVQNHFLLTAVSEEVSQAHFWMIDQLLLTLRQDSDRWLNAVTWFSIALPIGTAVAWGWSDGEISIMHDGIASALGSGCSGLVYSARDYLKPRIHQGLTRLGWNLLRRQIGM